MAAADADRNLLFGIIALQMDFITRDQLVAAMHAWVLEKSKPLGQILVALGALDPKLHSLLQPMVAAHVDRHGGDPARSLAALSTAGPARAPLAVVEDDDVQASLARVGAGDVDPDATRLPSQLASMGRPTSEGLRFRVLRPHAKGGIGVVSVAHDRELNREVALKEIQDHRADDPASRARFVMEAEVTGGLEHPGIVPVYGLGHHDDGRPYYAMRFIRGDSLKGAIEAFHRGEWGGSGTRALALRKLLRRFLDVCDAIAYAHSRGVLHRDLKPGNIMLGRYGETLVVDWGLAKARGPLESTGSFGEKPLAPSPASGSAETLPGSAIGTPAFMSPEQAAGDLDRLGTSSDVYSLGATLYCLLAGRPPVDGHDIGEVLRRVRDGDFPPPRRVDRGVAKGLDAICRKAMALRPDDRYASARGLADDLEHWLADEPVAAYREPIPGRLARWSRRHRTLVISATAITLTASTGAVLVYKERLERRTAEVQREASEREVGREKEVGQLREYHALLGQAREARRGGRLEWTWASRGDLARAARLETTARDPVELRTEAAAALAEVDLRRRASLGGEMSAYSLAYSPDGRFLALAQAKAQAFAICSVKVIDLQAIQEVRSLSFSPSASWQVANAVQDGARAVAFGPGGRLAVGARSGRVHFWDLSEAAPKAISWDAHKSEASGLAFSADGRALYTCSPDRSLKRWDEAKVRRGPHEPSHVFRSDSRLVGLSLDASNRALAVSGGGAIHLLDPVDLRPQAPSLDRGAGRVAFSPDGQSLAFDREGQVELISPGGGLAIATLRGPRAAGATVASVSKIAFSPDGSLLAVASSADVEHSVKLWDVASARQVATVNVGGTDNVDVAFSPDGRALAMLGDRGAWLFEVGGPDVQGSVAFHPRPVLAVDYAIDGRWLACLSGTEAPGGPIANVEVCLWDLAEGRGPTRRAAIEGALKADGVALDGEARVLAFRGPGPVVEFWGLEGAGDPKAMTVDSLSSFRLSADGSRLWGVAGDEVISLGLADGSAKTRWSNRSSLVLTGLSGLTCLDVGRSRALVGGRDGFVRLLRTSDGQPEAIWNPGGGLVRSVGLSPLEDHAVAGSQTGGVFLYRVADGEKVASWALHSDAVTATGFSGDGRLLASGSVDRTVRLYRRDNDRWGELMALPAFSGPIRTLRFGPGGRTLAIHVEGERAVRLWDLDRLRGRLAPMGLDWTGDGPGPAGGRQLDGGR